MKHHIDPKIDCVFKALLGAEDNRNLLVHFLNAILSNDLAAPIATVEIINPYNEREYLEDKLSIVDVKACDGQNHIFQIEIQLLNYANLPGRILYNWADIYSQQLQSGTDYQELKPTYSIWLLSENLIKESDDYAHTYKFRDEKGKTLVEHGGIWLLELNKFHAHQIENEQQRWLRFFKDGEQLNDVALPDWMGTEEMRQAMGTLRQFSEKEINYHAYQARQNFLREQQTIQHELEAAMAREKAAMAREKAAMDREKAALEEKQGAMDREQNALAEIERLKALLEQKSH